MRCRLVDGPTRDLNLMLSGVPGSMRRVVAGGAVATRSARMRPLRDHAPARCDATGADEHEPMPAHALRWWPQAPESLAFDGDGWWQSGAGATGGAATP